MHTLIKHIPIVLRELTPWGRGAIELPTPSANGRGLA